MKTLCVDTSHRHLVIALLEDEKVVASYMSEAWKKQSEMIFVELIRLMDEVKWKVDDLDEMVITKGPGSYTGVRIAMSIAKVLCTRKDIALYTLSTLQLYAGTDDVYVVLDARSNRVYFGDYTNGEMKKECIYTIDELKQYTDKKFVGDIDLLGKDKEEIDFVSHFVLLRNHYQKVENIHVLVPEYLKKESDYLVKK